MVRYDVEPVDIPEAGTAEEDLSFAVFSLAHAACGDEVIEVRIGEGTLLAWCAACSVMQIFWPNQT